MTIRDMFLKQNILLSPKTFMEPGVIGGRGGRVRIIGVVVVSATSFGLGATFLSDLEGSSVSFSVWAAAMATATVRGRWRGIGARGGGGKG